ncbi:MAG: type II secretion system F family protein, partial [Bacteriovoracaceae bacterium]
MAIYAYKGLNKTGKEVKATISSESVASAKQKLMGQGIMLTEIKEQKSASGGGSSFQFGTGISIADLALMTRQFSTLVKARIQIVEALQALENQSDHPKMREILSNVKQKVNEGISLAKALSEYPKVFNNVYINMVEAGEASGTLDVVLLRLAEFTESQQKLKNRIKSALTYPMIMIGAGSLMMGIIFTFVIPEITKIFKNSRKELPFLTEVTIALSDFIQNYWWAIILGIFMGYYFLKKYIATEKGRKWWDNLLLKIPVVSELVTMINVSRFCSSLATLLNSGVPILTALKITRNLMGNVHMQAAVEASKD